MTMSDNDDNRFFVMVNEHMPTFDTCYNFCNLPECGAVSSFVGTTRNSFKGKQVVMLSYEGYVPMAKKELFIICNDASNRWEVSKIAIVHKLGNCPVGDASVIIVASSPHRRASLEAVSFLIDELKATVPIWKREIYEGDEESVWKENIEWHEGKPKRVMIKDC